MLCPYVINTFLIEYCVTYIILIELTGSTTGSNQTQKKANFNIYFTTYPDPKVTQSQLKQATSKAKAQLV